MNKNISVWLIIPQTNLHVGNESVGTFSVIDKAIQRDVTTNLPCINSSSLKGAIKEYLTILANRSNKSETSITKDTIKKLFGSVKEKDGPSDNQKGLATFFDADLLFLPVQSDTNLYDLTYAQEIIDIFISKVKNLGYKTFEEKQIFNQISSTNQINVGEDEFKNSCKDEELPIIARNRLDNGESVNLWYEQVLPAKSVLATIIETPVNQSLDILNNQIVQIGANATIGYGFCQFVKIGG